MVGQAGSHGGSPLNPVLLGVGNPDRQTQAMMKVVQVIQATDNEHTGLEQRAVVSKVAGASGEPRNALPKGGVEPFNVSRIDDTTALTVGKQAVNDLLGPLIKPSADVEGIVRPLLDDLNNVNVGPFNQPRAALLARFSSCFRTEGPFEGPWITGQAINRNQNWTTQRTVAHLIRHSLNQ